MIRLSYQKKMSGIQLAQQLKRLENTHQNPVILNIRPDPNQNYTHALLAVGYDKDNQTIYINDPSNIVTEFSYEELNKRWNVWLYRPRFHSEQSGFILIKE